MATKITGTVKWFSNRKGFGFLAPTSDNAPTKEEVFVHHSSLVMVEGAYKTLAEGAEVEFEVEKDSNGKLKAVNVTKVGGEPLVPPPREKRRNRKPKPTGSGSATGEGGVKSGDEQEKTEVKPNNRNNKDNGGKKKENGRKPAAAKVGGGGGGAPANREPPFHNVIPDDVKETISAKGVKLVRNTVDLALGGARIKLGQGGYASLIDATCLIGEGTFTCDEKANVTFAWERCMQYSDGKWKSADVSKLMPSISLVDDDIKTVKAEETPQDLWGADKPDPKDAFAELGFKMKKIILTRPRSGRGRRNNSKAE